MLILILLLISYNLRRMLAEKPTFYKDIRFWLVITCLFILIGLTVGEYAL